MIDLSVYFVTDPDQCTQKGRTVTQTVLAAVAGGVSCVQLRHKDGSARDFLDQVIDVAQRVGDKVPIIVNDRVDVFLAARETGALVAGVHVGQSDLPAELVRRIVGDDAIIGLSASTYDEIDAARDVDYLGVAAIHTTLTKRDAPPPLGVSGAADRARYASLPCVAIGGIHRPDMTPLAQAGLAGAAVVSEICLADDPEGAARGLREAWDEGIGK